MVSRLDVPRRDVELRADVLLLTEVHPALSLPGSVAVLTTWLVVGRPVDEVRVVGLSAAGEPDIPGPASVAPPSRARQPPDRAVRSVEGLLQPA